MAASTIDKIKLWLFPGLMSCLAALIWADVSEIKSDVKTLMAVSIKDGIRIDNLEGKLKTASIPSAPKDEIPFMFERVAVVPDNRLFAQAKYIKPLK